jgi:hypothetical protein
MGRKSTRTTFMWVLGIGYKRYTLNQEGNNVIKMSQTILPFCMIERVQLFQKL